LPSKDSVVFLFLAVGSAYVRRGSWPWLLGRGAFLPISLDLS